MSSLFEIFSVMGRLGCIAFGGPVAHLAHFQRELVEKRKWVSEEEYADLIAFCQFLPGPASSQVGMSLGLLRGGLLGMFTAWFAFTMPSVILLLIAAAGLGALSDGPLGWLHGLLAGVVAIVADAVWKLGKKCCPDAKRVSLAIAAAIAMLLMPTAWMQLVIIALGAVAGLLLVAPPDATGSGGHSDRLGKGTIFFGWAILIGLVLLPIILALTISRGPEASHLSVYAAFAQTGSLVFGGGHVVLPMLQHEVVPPGWMTDEQFLAGYGVTQAMPGPIFTLSSYLGAVIGYNIDPNASSFLLFGGLALLGMFMPSFGMVAGGLPFWHRLRAAPKARQALAGINAAVIGLLIAALYQPVWTKAMEVEKPTLSVAVVLGAWLLLVVWKAPAWLVVALAAAAGGLIGL